MCNHHLLLERSANKLEFRLLQVQEYIKLGVKQRGCNGLAYTMNYANEKGKFDEEVSEKGVRLLIEPSALMHIIGTKMDFVSDRLKYVILYGERPPAHDAAPQKLSIDFQCALQAITQFCCELQGLHSVHSEHQLHCGLTHC